MDLNPDVTSVEKGALHLCTLNRVLHWALNVQKFVFVQIESICRRRFKCGQIDKFALKPVKNIVE